MAKIDTRLSLIYSGMYSIIGGFGIDAMASLFNENINPYTTLLKLGGAASVFAYAWRWSKFDRFFRNVNFGIDEVYPIEKGQTNHKKSIVYKFTLPSGLEVEKLQSHKNAMEQWLGKKVEIVWINRGLFIIEVYTNSSNLMYDYNEDIEVDGDVAFPVGYDLHENIVTCCLSNGDDNAHMMIGGTSGGGKSVLFNIIITYLITKKKVDLYLIDLKGTEFAFYENCKCVKQVVYEREEVLGMLLQVIKIMEERYKAMRGWVRNIIEYNEKSKKKMKYIVVGIDEYAEIMDDKEIQRAFERISSKARAAGIHLITSTQRPDSKVISSNVKNNLCVIAGLRTNTSINSRIIMDDDQLCKLRGKGHCIFRYAGRDKECQGMFIGNNEIKRLIEPFERVEEIVSDNLSVIPPTNTNTDMDVNFDDWIRFGGFK